MAKEKEIEWWEDTIDCPHCKYSHRATDSHEDDEGKWECWDCKKPFNVEIEYSPSYIVTKTNN